jgi:hypothetical protein
VNYEVEVTTFSPRLTSNQIETPDPERAIAFVAEALHPECCIVVAAVENGVSYGDFMVWLNGDEAVVRLDEHREHFGASPSRATAVGELEFRDADATTFLQPANRTSDREGADTALVHWLRTRNKSPALTWD